MDASRLLFPHLRVALERCMNATCCKNLDAFSLESGPNSVGAYGLESALGA